ncbi:MAG TPA: TolC family protein [Polyangiaceae bacterium]|nr:TolC family protein [Polyangiaceae bacterium]
MTNRKHLVRELPPYAVRRGVKPALSALVLAFVSAQLFSSEAQAQGAPARPAPGARAPGATPPAATPPAGTQPAGTPPAATPPPATLTAPGARAPIGATPGAAAPATGAAAPAPATEPNDEAAAVLVAQPGGLTAQHVAERSAETSQSVRVRLAELDSARAKLDQTTAQFFPRLTLRASYTRLSKVKSQIGPGGVVGAQANGGVFVDPNCQLERCPVVDSEGTPIGAQSLAFPALQNNYALTASLSVPISDYVLRLSTATSGAAATERASQLNAKAERLKVQTDARAVFYDWLRAKARVRISEKSLDRVRARLKDARVAFELGTITRADVMRLEAQAAATEQVVLESRAYQDMDEVQLAVFLGDAEPRTYENGEDISSLPAERRDTLAALTREAFSNRIELQALGEASEAARLASKAVQRAGYPRVDATGDVTYANPNQRYFPQRAEWKSTWSVGIAASWTIGDVFVNNASARDLAATSRSLEAQRAQLRDAIRQEVANQYLALTRARGALESARRGLAAAQEAYRVASDLYRVGKATTTEVIDAETELLSARISELNAGIDLRIADLRLTHAAGRDVPR